MPKVSVIVPVYKAEQYLHRCVDSILSQSLTDWELILVDDGSPDRSGAICDEYAAKDRRIKVFHKENGGVSSARNLGLEMMVGEWVTFVDADDWIASDTLEKCSTHFDEYEVVRFSMKMVYDEQDDTKNRNYIIPSSNNKEEIFARTLARNTLMCVCGGFYRADLFRQNNIRFSTSLVMAEDWLVIMQLLLKAHNVIDLPEVYYFYNQLNESSCSNNPTVKKVENCFEALAIIEDSIDKTQSVCIMALGQCRCVLWKALIKTIFTSSDENKLKTIKQYKNRFEYPSCGHVIHSSINSLGKVVCIICSFL